MDKFPAVLAWLERIKARPAVKRGSENYNKE
jgi:glutathione S-transferase